LTQRKQGSFSGNEFEVKFYFFFLESVDKAMEIVTGAKAMLSVYIAKTSIENVVTFKVSIPNKYDHPLSDV
jgi:hypothetical protein